MPWALTSENMYFATISILVYTKWLQAENLVAIVFLSFSGNDKVTVCWQNVYHEYNAINAQISNNVMTVSYKYLLLSPFKVISKEFFCLYFVPVKQTEAITVNERTVKLAIESRNPSMVTL